MNCCRNCQVMKLKIHNNIQLTSGSSVHTRLGASKSWRHTGSYRSGCFWFLWHLLQPHFTSSSTERKTTLGISYDQLLRRKKKKQKAGNMRISASSGLLQHDGPWRRESEKFSSRRHFGQSICLFTLSTIKEGWQFLYKELLICLMISWK